MVKRSPLQVKKLSEIGAHSAKDHHSRQRDNIRKGCKHHDQHQNRALSSIWNRAGRRVPPDRGQTCADGPHQWGSVCNKGPYVEIFAQGTPDQIKPLRPFK